MGKHTPKMNILELGDYLNRHLGDELEWTLRAAAEWYVQNTLKLNISGYEVEVFTMDSCFLHSRTLFEFFTHETTNYYYGCNEFKIDTIDSELYGNDDNPGWNNVLHAFMMHAQNRSEPEQLITRTGEKKDLNKMPLEFAKEVVRLWGEFIERLSESEDRNIQKLSGVADSCLKSALKNANSVLRSEMVKSMSKRKEVKLQPIKWI